MRSNHKVFAICDTETEYAFRLMEYLSRRNRFPFEMRIFTSAERLLHFAGSHPVEILLISEENMNDAVGRADIGQILLLSEEKNHRGTGSFPGIYKYQSSAVILKEVMDTYDWREEEREPAGQAGKARMIGTFSPSAYQQQMFFSLAAAEVLACEKAVLYVSLMEFSGLEELSGNRYEKDMGDFLYLLQSGQRENAPVGLAQSIGNLDLIPPFRNPSDLTDTEEETWTEFFGYLKTQTRYEVVWIDIGHMIPRVMPFLRACDEIYMPSAEDSLSAARDRSFSEALRLFDDGEEIRKNVRKVHPPVIAVPGNGEGFPELLKKTGIGNYAAQVLSGQCPEEKTGEYQRKENPEGKRV